MRIETSHPVLVSVESDDIAPCPRAEECRRWGQGIVEFSEDSDQEFSARTIWTYSGCETEGCRGPLMTNGQVGSIKTPQPAAGSTRETALLESMRDAEVAISLAVEALPLMELTPPAILGFPDPESED